MLVIVLHEYSMLKLIFNKNDSFFSEKKLASSRGAPQGNDAKFTFAIHPQRIHQFHDNIELQNSKVPDCCHIGTSLPPI